MADTAVTARPFFDALYRQLFESGLRYFLPDATIEAAPADVDADPLIAYRTREPDVLEFTWLGSHYRVINQDGEFTEDQTRIIGSIGRVLSIRHRLAFHPVLTDTSAHLFRGLPEDRYVSAFLDQNTYRDPEATASKPDRIADAIEVLRLSSLSTYENRRISSGVILFGAFPDVCHELPPVRSGALRFSSSLVSARSFYRLTDGLKTVALVDESGYLVELVDVEEWADPFKDYELPAPVAARYEAHCRATICGGHICMILTPNGDIKVFAEGSQIFTFRDGRWRLASTPDSYRVWRESVGNEELAHRLFTVALNLAEERRGALFVVMDDLSRVSHLIADHDLLNVETTGSGSLKQRFHYLLRDRDVLKLSHSVLETVARIDGAIVIGPDTRLLAFGAILRNSLAADAFAGEGSRTVAAYAASHFGSVLKVSEDGKVSCFRNGRCLWEI